MPSLAAHPKMLERPVLIRRDAESRGHLTDREPALLTSAHEAGGPIHDFETWDRICSCTGWPQAFVAKVRS